jgi:hypothetical protein
MKEEYVRHRHCFEVSSTQKVEHLLVPKPILDDGSMAKDLEFKPSDGGDVSASDNESAASGHTDVSSSTCLSLLSENSSVVSSSSSSDKLMICCVKPALLSMTPKS